MNNNGPERNHFSPTGGNGLHLSNEELSRLLNMEASFDLETSLADVFADGDATELMNIEYDVPIGIMKGGMDEKQNQKSSLLAPSSAQRNAATAPITMAAAGSHPTLQMLPCMYPQNTIPVYVDVSTGQILSFGFQWPQFSSNGMPAGILQTTQPNTLQNFVPGIIGSPMMSQHTYSHNQTRRPTIRKRPTKRKRTSNKLSATTETISQRGAKAEQGFTYDPATERMYRHGAALETTARDNKEIPLVKAIFETFKNNNAFSGASPTQHTNQQHQHGVSESIENNQNVVPPLSTTSLEMFQLQLQNLPTLTTHPLLAPPQKLTDTTDNNGE